MGQALANWILKILGWKIEGIFPPPDKKFMLIVAPHTSNWDFPLGILVRKARNAKVMFMAKNSLFRWPHGFIFRWLGGYPVDRTGNKNYVQNVAGIFKRHETFAVIIAPEGTRQKVNKFKTGFYFIAKEANIPIQMCKFDYSIKTATFDKPFYPTDVDTDMEIIMRYYKGIDGKNKELGID